MEIFYTKTYNLSGDNDVKQRIVETAARELGFEELSLFRFPDKSDNDEELHYRMDGITAAVSDESVVIFQYPSMVSARYDRFLIEHLKRRRELKLILFVQDFGNTVFPDGYANVKEEIELFNQADLLILQSEKMEEYLKKEGLADIPVMYQEVWDYPYDISRNSIKIEKRLERITDISVNHLMGIKSAGVGMISDFSSYYMDMCNPLRTGFYICAGIPVVAKSGSRLADFIGRYRIGIFTETYDEANKIVETLTDEQLNDIKSNINKISRAISGGIYTKTLLQDAVYEIVTKNVIKSVIKSN